MRASCPSSCAARARLPPSVPSSASPRNAAGRSRSSPPPRPRFLRSGRHREGHRQPRPQPVQQARRAPLPDSRCDHCRPGQLQHDQQVGTGHQRHLRPGVLAETTGLDVPIVVLPFVNSTLVGRESFRRSAEGVRILPGPGGFQPRKSQSPHLSGAGRGTAQTLSTRGSARACRRPGPRR